LDLDDRDGRRMSGLLERRASLEERAHAQYNMFVEHRSPAGRSG